MRPSGNTSHFINLYEHWSIMSVVNKIMEDFYQSSTKWKEECVIKWLQEITWKESYHEHTKILNPTERRVCHQLAVRNHLKRVISWTYKTCMFILYWNTKKLVIMALKMQAIIDYIKPLEWRSMCARLQVCHLNRNMYVIYILLLCLIHSLKTWGVIRPFEQHTISLNVRLTVLSSRSDDFTW